MERKIIPDSENRLLLLYALRQLGQATDAQLIQLFADCGEMNYIELRLAQAGLDDSGLIAQRQHPAGPLWHVTEAGIFQLESFGGRIPQSRREAAAASAQRWAEAFRLEREAPAERIRLADGSPCVCLHLLNGLRTEMEILLPLPPGERLPLLQQRWQRCAAQTYRLAMVTLCGEGGAGTAAASFAPDEAGGLVTLSLEGAQAIQLTLRVEDAAAAGVCAAAWHEKGADFRLRLLELLRSAA